MPEQTDPAEETMSPTPNGNTEYETYLDRWVRIEGSLAFMVAGLSFFLIAHLWLTRPDMSEFLNFTRNFANITYTIVTGLLITFGGLAAGFALKPGAIRRTIENWIGSEQSRPAVGWLYLVMLLGIVGQMVILSPFVSYVSTPIIFILVGVLNRYERLRRLPEAKREREPDDEASTES